MSTEDVHPGGLDAAIEAIWVRHRPLMFSRMDTIDNAVAAAVSGSLSETLRTAAHHDAHKLAGSLGTFGLHDGSRHARSLELALEDAENVAEKIQGLQDDARALRAQLESRSG